MKYLHTINSDIFAGASPKNLPVFESLQDDLKNKIMTFRTKDDFLDIEDSMHDPKCKNIVIIGGGFLGSELACSLARNCMSLLSFVLFYPVTNEYTNLIRCTFYFQYLKIKKYSKYIKRSL